MARSPSRHPTELELEILKILWRLGSATVGQVRDALAGYRDLAYTSVMTTMSTMHDKGYLARAKEGMGYVYQAAVSEKDTAQGMLKDLLNRVFERSPEAVLTNLLETSDLDAEELKRLRKLINHKLREETP